MGEAKSFAVGHFALGYILGKLTAEKLGTKINIPLILTLSVIPDVDILIPLLAHRGPTHSVIVSTILFTPLFLKMRREALPYFIALIQHPLVGDFLAGGEIQLLWPITSKPFGMPINIESVENITFEWALFTLSIIVLFRSGDLKILLQSHRTNVILLIPLVTVVLPTFLAYPLDVPLPLIPPHLFFIALLASSILADLLTEIV